MSEQGFHEIQLNGKQLVFLFMAATVVSVVIFLCGVMVGRGVRPASAAAPSSAAAAAADPDLELGGLAASPPGTEIPGAQETGPASPAQAPEHAPPPVQDDDDYDFDARLTEQKTAERLEPPPAARPEPPPAAPPAAAPARAAARAEPTADKAPAAATASDGGRPLPGTYAVQLVALRDRADADTIARRLVGKGYAAYVVMPSAGAAPVYRVQVGKYKTRGEAEKVAARLRSEEQFKPWVTR